jgi:hypothetical protein
MDKEILAIIGRLYIENIGLFNTVESLQKRIEQLETDSKILSKDGSQ